MRFDILANIKMIAQKPLMGIIKLYSLFAN